MPLFQYKAVSPTGEVQEGVLDAPSQSATIEHLQGLGLIPIRATETSAGDSRQGGAAAVPAKTLGAGMFAARRVTQNNVTVFTREIATLLKAGLPLDRGMEILVDLAENERVRELLANIRNEVRGGASLSKALDQRRDVFSRFYVNMVRAGEAGGQLPGVLRRLAEHMERSRELKASITSALTYPVILMVIAVLSIAVMLVFVVPQFKQIFSQAGQALPMLTRVVLGLGDLVRNGWWLMLAGLIVAGWLFARSLAIAESRKRWDARFLDAPLLGDLLAKLEMARFARTLATLIGNGVPLLAGLAIVRETMGNLVMADAVGHAAGELKEGRGLARPMLETQRFPKLAVQMIAVGEETGRLDEMLLQVADTYDSEVQHAVKRMMSLIEPLMIVFMALVVGLIILAILVPMLDMFSLPF